MDINALGTLRRVADDPSVKAAGEGLNKLRQERDRVDMLLQGGRDARINAAPDVYQRCWAEAMQGRVVRQAHASAIWGIAGLGITMASFVVPGGPYISFAVYGALGTCMGAVYVAPKISDHLDKIRVPHWADNGVKAELKSQRERLDGQVAQAEADKKSLEGRVLERMAHQAPPSSAGPVAGIDDAEQLTIGSVRLPAGTPP